MNLEKGITRHSYGLGAAGYIRIVQSAFPLYIIRA